jgi:DNA primase
MTSLKQHILDRHVDMNLHTVWLDEVERVATFPLWNLSGELVGYQAYRPDADKVQKNDEKGRYYTYKGNKLVPCWMDRPKHNRTIGVWGLESWNLSTTLFVTEGIFDAARLTQRGYSAIAVLSNDPNTSTLNWLLQVRTQRPTVAICDPGAAGRKLAKTAHKAHTVCVTGNTAADLGDVDDDYVTKVIQCYT